MIPITDLRLGVARLARRMRFAPSDRTVSDSQLATLFALHFDGPLPLGQLAQHERVTPASMSYTVNALEAHGFIRRSPTSDARRRDLHITDAGRTHVAKVLEERDEWLSDRVAALSDSERDALAAAVPVLRALAES